MEGYRLRDGIKVQRARFERRVVQAKCYPYGRGRDTVKYTEMTNRMGAGVRDSCHHHLRMLLQTADP